MAECVHNGLYLVHARNFSLGVWDASIKEFKGIRCKFGSRFIDDEWHYNRGMPYGTAKPYRLLEMWPGGDDGQLFEYLDQARERYKTLTEKLYDEMQKCRQDWEASGGKDPAVKPAGKKKGQDKGH
jgi:hypothetical protein